MKRDLTKGSIAKNIIHLAWPVMLGMVLHTGFNIIDTIFVGKVSAEALAAISMSFPIVFFMIALSSGLSIGTSSLIARLLGSKKEKEAMNSAEHSLLLALIITIFFTVAGLLSSRIIFGFMGAEGDILNLAVAYTNIIFLGSAFIFFTFAFNSILRGEGDTKTPMKIMVFSIILNIVLDPILIFGWWIFPKLGIGGAALATVIARAVGAIIVGAFVLKGKAFIKLDFKNFKYKYSIVKDIFRVGFPASLNNIMMSIGSFFFIKMASLFGPYAIAVMGLGTRIDAVAIMPALGMATAVITIVGFNVGAKNYERAEKTAWMAALMAFILLEIIGVMFFIMPRFWITMFNKHSEVVSIGINYIRIISLVYGFIGVSIILSSAFQGAGKGYPSLMITVIRIFIVGLPLAYFLSVMVGLKTIGIWLGFSVSSIITFIVTSLWFKMGTWKKGKVLKKDIPEVVG